MDLLVVAQLTEFQSSEALFNRESSFLDTSHWHNTMRTPIPSKEADSYTMSLRDNNERMAHLSTLMKDFDLFCETSENDQKIKELLDLLQRFKKIRIEIKSLLRNDCSVASTKRAENEPSAIIQCKHALALLIVDTNALKLFDFVHSSALLGLMRLENIVEEGTKRSFTLQKEFIENEIEDVFALTCSNLLASRRATPFSTRKMGFMCRVMCVERRKRGVHRHHVWDRLEAALLEMGF
jgi:hypothetical protein